ncbi:hypothetical protein [Actinomadura parmotrematis]|uniref:Uncharacterized protein n=1 Tax=Actinomadura parmotrematis TaxID=2864039 RepID=A0ABS7FW72_9ACTN|nr:hypothetical protein [Actinomadura parmotrematis]MBW8484420.1 hypothetical protein [Actinomadura parmotrematis]
MPAGLAYPTALRSDRKTHKAAVPGFVNLESVLCVVAVLLVAGLAALPKRRRSTAVAGTALAHGSEERPGTSGLATPWRNAYAKVRGGQGASTDLAFGIRLRTFRKPGQRTRRELDIAVRQHVQPPES